MQAIKQIEMFECPITHKLFKTKKAAEKSAAKAQLAVDAAKVAAEEAKVSDAERLARADFIRFNLADIKDLPAMMTAKAAESGVTIKDLDISVRFGKVSNSHGAPIGQNTNWSGHDKNRPLNCLGWSGQISALVEKSSQTKDNHHIASDILFGKWNDYSLFRGFHTGSGCSGSPNYKYKMDIGFYFFLDDFPLLKVKYDEFMAQKELSKENEILEIILNDKANNCAKNDTEVIKLNDALSKLMNKRDSLYSEIIAYYKQINPSKLNEIAENYGELERIFS